MLIPVIVITGISDVNDIKHLANSTLRRRGETLYIVFAPYRTGHARRGAKLYGNGRDGLTVRGVKALRGWGDEASVLVY